MIQKIIGVIGAGRADASLTRIAEEVGRLIALKGARLICGGLGGVMEAASRGAKAADGLTIGILPHDSTEEANPYIDVPVATGFGEGRNIVIIRTADLIIAIGGEYGTLSEIAFALKLRKPVIGINTWEIRGIIKADTPDAAVAKAFDLLRQFD
jgi:uncharacterized protein (TIGR00725 family)